MIKKNYLTKDLFVGNIVRVKKDDVTILRRGIFVSTENDLDFTLVSTDFQMTHSSDAEVGEVACEHFVPFVKYFNLAKDVETISYETICKIEDTLNKNKLTAKDMSL